MNLNLNFQVQVQARSVQVQGHSNREPNFNIDVKNKNEYFETEITIEVDSDVGILKCHSERVQTANLQIYMVSQTEIDRLISRCWNSNLPVQVVPDISKVI